MQVNPDVSPKLIANEAQNLVTSGLWTTLSQKWPVRNGDKVVQTEAGDLAELFVVHVLQQDKPQEAEAILGQLKDHRFREHFAEHVAVRVGILTTDEQERLLEFTLERDPVLGSLLFGWRVRSASPLSERVLESLRCHWRNLHLTDDDYTHLLTHLLQNRRGDLVRRWALRSYKDDPDKRSRFLNTVHELIVESPDADEQIYFLIGISNARPEATTELARRLIDNPNPNLRRAAVRALSYADSSSLELLRRILDDVDPAVRSEGITVLRLLGDRRVKGAIELLAHGAIDYPELRPQIRAALTLLPTEQARTTITGFHHAEDPELRRLAFEVEEDWRKAARALMPYDAP